MARKKNELYIRAEKFLNENPDKTLKDFRAQELKINPNVPLLKTKHKKGQPIKVSEKTAGTTNAEKLRQRLQTQSPGIDAAEKAKRKQLFDTLEHMKFVDPEGGWNLEHVERVKDFDAGKYGLGHQAHDLPNLKIQSGKDAKLKTAAEALGDKWNSWNASVYHDDVILYNRSSYDPNFPERAIPVKESDLKAHKKFLETGSLEGATPQNKKVIKFLLSERASKDLPIEKQRLAFLESAAQDKGVSKTTSTLAKKLSSVNGAVNNGVNGVNGSTNNHLNKIAKSQVIKKGSKLLKNPAVRTAAGLGALGILGSGLEMKAAVNEQENPNTSPLNRKAADLKLISEALAVQSLGLPAAFPTSLAAKGAELHLRNRDKFEKNRYNTASDRLRNMPTNLKIRKTLPQDAVRSLELK